MVNQLIVPRYVRTSITIVDLQLRAFPTQDFFSKRVMAVKGLNDAR